MSNSALAQWAFLVLLADPDDRAGLAQLLTDVTQPEAKSRVVYLAAPVGGKKFFAKDAETTDWAVRNVSEDAQRVHLLMHEPGLRQVVANHEGLFYIGVTNRDEVRAYDGADRVTAFVTEGPLDFVPRVMHDWDGTAEAHDALFAKGAARQVLALTTDSPLSPEDLEAYGAAPEVDDGLVRAIQRSFPSAILPATSVVSDIWTVDDKLGYQPFADAIAVFLRHRDTRPPLTVGIRAPWGAGKTSLMRMIRETLDPCEADGRRSTVELVDTGQTPARGPSVATVLRIARRHGLPEPQSATVDANRLVTVWFNPWMYQTGEQIWAGLANEIIKQVTCRMTFGQRETFWLRINLRRVDREAVRQVIFSVLLRRLASVAWLVIATAVAAVALLLTSVSRTVSGIVLAAGGGITLAAALLQYLLLRREKARDVLGNLVRWRDPLQPETASSDGGAALTFVEPSYAARAGFLQFVQSDVRAVLDLVATEGQPLVVFIDDLDRCSPGVVAQVIEAVNVFLAGEFPNCLFVIAMEPRATVASIEVAYGQSLAGLSSPADEGPSLGWRFLDKLVQLPLQLPAADKQKVLLNYLYSLDQPVVADPGSASIHGGAGNGDGSPADADGSEDVPADAAAQADGADLTGLPELAAGPGQALSRTGLISQLRQASTLDEISNIADRLRRAGAAPDEDVVLAATEVFDSRFRPTNAEVNAAVSNELAILRVVNAREVKRFVNLFRFYAVIGVRRRLQGYESATIREAATLAALAARWPNVVGLAGEPSVLTALSNKPPSGGQAPDSRLGDIKPQRLAALATFLSAPEHALSAGALSLLVG